MNTLEEQYGGVCGASSTLLSVGHKHLEGVVPQTKPTSKYRAIIET